MLLPSFYQVCLKFPDLKKIIHGWGGWEGVGVDGWVVFVKDKDGSEHINVYCNHSPLPNKSQIYIFRKSSELQPIHIHQMNYFFGRCLLLISCLLVLTGTQFEGPDICLSLVFHHFCRTNLKFDIILMQVDRLLAISTPFFHHDQVME